MCFLTRRFSVRDASCIAKFLSSRERNHMDLLRFLSSRASVIACGQLCDLQYRAAGRRDIGAIIRTAARVNDCGSKAVIEVVHTSVPAGVNMGGDTFGEGQSQSHCILPTRAMW